MKTYMLIREIGRGGTSCVYLGADKRTGEKVAVKRYESRDSFWLAKRECQLLQGLCHPGIPVFREAWETEEGGCVVMEYVPGMTLKEKIVREGAVNEKQAVVWGMEICDILAYLHRHEPTVIFRDIKPGNIMITTLSHVKLVDFGAAVPGKHGVGYAAVPVGTKGYAAPEQWVRDGVLDTRTDIYGFGAVMRYMLTGRHPVDVEQGRDRLSVKMRAIVSRCMQAEPDRRYRFCEEIKRDLQNPEFSGKSHVKFRILRSELRCPESVHNPAQMASDASFPCC